MNICLFFIISATVGQLLQDDLTSIIIPIFPGAYDDSSTNDQNENSTVFPLQPQPGNHSCECVPIYLCESETVNNDGIIDLIVDEKFQCEHYLKVCCPKQKKLLRPPNYTVNKLGCGIRNPEGVGFRIPGHKYNEVEFGEFPWMVAILRYEIAKGENSLVYRCGGSLIHPKVVLTAAHCVISNQNRYKVRVGEWDTQTRNEIFPHQDADVATVITHPQYDSKMLYNDIALLILDTFISISPHVDTICLTSPPQGEDVDLGNCYSNGWGKDVFGKEGKYQVLLKKIELPIVPRDVCQENLRKTRLGQHFDLHKSLICAGGAAGKDACIGDGGSSLVCPMPGKLEKYYQAGIVSWGVSCGQQDVPIVYTNVTMFFDWINWQLSNYSIDQSYYTI